MRIRRAHGPSRAQVRRQSPVTAAARRSGLRDIGRRVWWAVRGGLMGLGAVALAYGAWAAAQGAVEHPALSVRNLLVTGCETVTPEEAARAAGVEVGEPILRLDLERARALARRHPLIRDVAVSRQLPDTVRIAVEERRPLAVVPGAEFLTVDRDGFVLRRSVRYDGSRPLVPVPSAAAGRRRVEEAVPALRVLEAVAASGVLGPDRVSEAAQATDGRILVSLVDSGTVLVMSPQGAAEEARRLGRLMASGNFDPAAAGYDLRFTDRVVRVPGRDEIQDGRGPAESGRRNHGQG